MHADNFTIKLIHFNHSFISAHTFKSYIPFRFPKQNFVRIYDVANAYNIPILSHPTGFLLS
jgi:hypothetical protein